jgi:hypothetical protein
MTRTMYRDYAFEAYARSRAKRDRGKREGPDHQINGVGARNADQLGRQICTRNTPQDSPGQLDDQDYFTKFERADYRLRDVVAADGLGGAASALLRVIVARRSGKKIFVWRAAPVGGIA